MWSFDFDTEAKLGDLLVVEIEGVGRTDIYYAQGMNEWVAMGRHVKRPLAAMFKVRYPNQLFLTLKNQDEIKTTISEPIIINYWI